jgi:hypothetical protein
VGVGLGEMVELGVDEVVGVGAGVEDWVLD